MSYVMDKGLLNINQAGHSQEVKILTILKSNDIFGPNFAYIFIVTLSRHRYAKWRPGFAKHQFGHLWSICEITHYSIYFDHLHAYKF